MTWLARLKNQNVPAKGTAKTDRTPLRQVLAVLSVTPAGVSEKSHSSRPVLNFRLPGYAPNEWATALGRPGETVESLRADLTERWPGVEVRQ